MAVFIGAVRGSNPLTARTKKNQTNINKAVYWGKRYEELVNLGYNAENNDDFKLQRKYERKQEDAWNKFVDYFNELPKSEQKRVEKFVFG